jgi:hypothetical protein
MEGMGVDDDLMNDPGLDVLDEFLEFLALVSLVASSFPGHQKG